MLKSLKNLKLQTQFIVLTCIYCILTTLLGTYLFTNMNKILNKKIYESTEQVFNHIEVEILKFVHDVETSANTIAYVKALQDYINSSGDTPSSDFYSNVRLSFNSVMLTNKNIESVLLDLKNTDVLFSDINVVLDNVKNIEIESYKTHFSQLLPYSYVSNSTPLRYFAAVHRINNLRNLTSKEYCGNVILLLKKDFFDDISSRYGITKNSKIYIINSDNEVVGGMDNSGSNSSIEQILKQPDSSGSSSIQKINGIKHIYHTRNAGTSGWRIASLTPYKEYFHELNTITTITFIMFFAFMTIVLAFSFLIAVNINHPIQHILVTMKNIGNGNLKTRCEVNLKNELGILSTHFNAMMDEIHTLTHTIFQNQQKLYELELANKDARFLALQSQINPHFLYNALACIQGIALHYEASEITEVTQALASIFRYSIKENNHVTISAEVENIKSYVMIYQIKSAEKINFILDIEPELYCLIVPKLLLQPIVENAIIHGLSRKVGGGTLIVRGHAVEDTIIFEISDDGIGMSKKQLEQLNKVLKDELLPSELKNEKHSIGIINIKQRLNLCFNSHYSFAVESKPFEGTKITIQIPWEKGGST